MEQSITFTDITIIESIMDKKKKKGFSKSNGTNVNEIKDITGFSLSKIRSSLKKFKDMGWIEEGIKEERVKNYYVTEKGFLGIAELTQITVDLKL